MTPNKSAAANIPSYESPRESDDPKLMSDIINWKNRHEEIFQSSGAHGTDLPNECRRRLEVAVKNIADVTEPETRGLLLSGGLDSSAILQAASSQGITFAVAITVLIVREDANKQDNDNENDKRNRRLPPDALYAKFAAEQHVVKHLVIELTPKELLDQQLAKTIRTLAVWGTMDTRNSLVIGAALEKAKELGMTDVIVGDGSDELFGGYQFTLGSPNGDGPDRWKERRDAMVNQWTFVTKKLGNSHGITVHQPFTDREVLVDWALEKTLRSDCVADDLLTGTAAFGKEAEPMTLVQGLGKLVLRQAYSGLCRSAWRPWNPIDVGSGAAVVGIKNFWKSHPTTNDSGGGERYTVSDKEFAEAETLLFREHGIIITSKEHLVNIRVYQKLFGGGNNIGANTPDAVLFAYESPFLHPTKKKYPIGDPRGCAGCCFDILDATFCHVCDRYPAQRT
jgi:7-cyano-7-deazaguanine synthase in queuosine biosynthesis